MCFIPLANDIFIYTDPTRTYPLQVFVTWEAPIPMKQGLCKGIFRAVSNIYDGTNFAITFDLRCWQGPKYASGMVVSFTFLIFFSVDIGITFSKNLQKQSSFLILACDFLVQNLYILLLPKRHNNNSEMCIC